MSFRGRFLQVPHSPVRRPRSKGGILRRFRYEWPKCAIFPHRHGRMMSEIGSTSTACRELCLLSTHLHSVFDGPRELVKCVLSLLKSWAEATLSEQWTARRSAGSSLLRTAGRHPWGRLVSGRRRRFVLRILLRGRWPSCNEVLKNRLTRLCRVTRGRGRCSLQLPDN